MCGAGHKPGPWAVRGWAGPGPGFLTAHSQCPIVITSAGNQPATHTTHIMINDILSAAETLRIELDKQDEQNAKVVAAKAHLLQLMIDAGPACENTLRVQWGQIQRVTTTEWEYRDRGVTAQNKVVEGAKRALASASKLLKGLQDAARAAGKAKAVSESVSLRIVRGNKG